jgi:hypothetical protein
MNSLLLAAAAVMLASGLILGFVARSYRTEKYAALSWYKTFISWERVHEYYAPPGPTLCHLSSSLSTSGALLLLVALAIK